MEISTLKQRILDISLKHNLSHLSSCLTSVDILDEIYATRRDDEPVILSNGHAGLALYVILEKYYGKDAEELLLKHGVHPNFDAEDGIYCSTGSLGLGITVSVGYALARRDQNVYCLISDGESFEGSVWESLNFAHKAKLDNLKIYANINGQAAYDLVDSDRLIAQLTTFLPSVNIRKTHCDQFPFLNGIQGHYHVQKQ